ncbi:MAG TPA: CoA-binding protein [Bacteroidales bacterium]|nr:CoA-binding protein [Bacteroidales bacterium]
MKIIPTVVLGVSRNSERFANQAVKALINYGHPVYAVGKEDYIWDGTEVHSTWDKVFDVHTVTIYLRPELQKVHQEKILSIKPRRIIFNPGTYNPELAEAASEAGIEVLEECTLVMLASGQF